MEPNVSSPVIIEHKAYARIGLLGNPSDVYYGRTISLSIENFWACVRLEPSDDLLILPHPTHDLVKFGSLSHLVNRLENEGYYGGVRLLMAICKVFTRYCKEQGIHLHDRNFSLSYDTNIPRQTGLSGSSAIACAAFSCLLDFYNVRDKIPVKIRPQLILNAEKELGIVAGLQDRVAQVYGGLVYMDFNKASMNKFGHGNYIQLDTSLLPPLYLIYAENPSDSGKVHSAVRQRWLDGDEFIISSMEEVANLALEGKSALLEKDYAKLAALMNRNFDLRRLMFGDVALAFARIGLLGNPSDVYYGRTISLNIQNFWASVRLQPSSDLVILPHPTHDLVKFSSVSHLVNRLENVGYYGGVRLLIATCKGIYLHDKNFSLSYDTNIPRQTGLSGSSAIVCATFSCLLDFYNVRDKIAVEVRPQLILNAEKELGIVAGLQDRVAQVYGGLLYMDFNKESMDKYGHGEYTQLDTSLLPPLHLIYAENPSDSGKVHSAVRQRWLDGDEFIVSSMEEVANLALEGKTALLEKDYAKLATLMNKNFDLRRRMFGDAALGSLNIEMVEVARRVGAASKFTGSGGAVVAFCPDGPSQVELLTDACKKAGFTILPVKVVPSLLNEIDIRSQPSKNA
ncbi:hypothetical protein M8C21_007090 [Ambrosia artemisiifolia]|uniref:glucuronokinase n=1 Tax=Ambrosia artemisiifolia TaxID=4212 RepID=A0AAD5GAY7_AMBAR|nr:hypothetical protein M8C21_007090 [Ambrosia artemisiifolia]